MPTSSHPISNIIQRCLTCTGVISNLILINLIIFRSPKDLGLYKYLMIYISSFELLYGALEFLVVPELFSLDSAFFVILDPKAGFLPQGWLQMMDLFYCGSFAVSLVIFGCQFAYRYQVLKGNDYWTSSRPRNFFIWIGSSVIFSIFYSFFVQFFMQRNKYTEKILRDYGHSGDFIKNIGFLGFMFYPKLENGTTIVNWDSFIGVSVTTSTLLCSEFAMIYFAFKCFQATKSMIHRANYSSNFRRLQWQLFYALVAQTIIPILCMQIPMTTVYFTTIVLGKSHPIIGHCQSFSIAFYLATDALPTIFIIKQYRDTVVRVLCFWKRFRRSYVAPQGPGTNTSNSKNLKISITPA